MSAAGADQLNVQGMLIRRGGRRHKSTVTSLRERLGQRSEALHPLADRCYSASSLYQDAPTGRRPMMPDQMFVFILIGFFAQLVDGALGMAFGVLCTTSLLAFGVPPAAASAMTHVTELFTTAASGASHVFHGNIDWRLVRRLAPAGMIGGATGAILLANVDGATIAPYVSGYLAAMGGYIIFKAMRPLWPREVRDWVVPFAGLGGGVLDAAGGGGGARS